MSRLVCAVALAGAAWAGTASAQDFRGMELSAEVLSFTDDGDIGQTAYRGSLEFGVFGAFGVAADLSFYDFAGDDGVTNANLHAFYEVSDATAVGLFYGRESYGEDATADAIGVEGLYGFGYARLEGSLGFVDDEVEDFWVAGFDGTYDFTPNISLIGGASLIQAEESSQNRISLGGEYRFGNGPAVYGEVGRVGFEDEGATYIGLGARIGLGRNGGTTFDSRGYSEELSGF